MFEKLWGTACLLAGLAGVGAGAVMALDVSGMDDRAAWKGYPGSIKNRTTMSAQGTSVDVGWKDEAGEHQGAVPSSTGGLAWAEALLDKPVEVLVYRPRIGGQRLCVASRFEPCKREHADWAWWGSAIGLAAVGLGALAYGARVLREA